MNYLIQLLVILVFSFLGELLHHVIPLPIPASIYGMVLLFAALSLKLVRLEQVKDTGGFLTGVMAVMFVCPAVGLLNCWDLVREQLLPILLITVLTLVLTFVVSGRVTQLLMKRGGAHND